MAGTGGGQSKRFAGRRPGHALPQRPRRWRRPVSGLAERKGAQSKLQRRCGSPRLPTPCGRSGCRCPGGMAWGRPDPL